MSVWFDALRLDVEVEVKEKRLNIKGAEMDAITYAVVKDEALHKQVIEVIREQTVEGHLEGMTEEEKKDVSSGLYVNAMLDYIRFSEREDRRALGESEALILAYKAVQDDGLHKMIQDVVKDKVQDYMNFKGRV